MDAEQILSIDVINGTINPLPGIRDPGDAGLNVQFLEHSHFDDVQTREQGRPVFRMAEYIRITIPGNMNDNVFRPIRVTDMDRFPTQYAAYKLGRTQSVGIPLTEWPQISRAQVDELAFFKIKTVEELASVSDGNAQKFMGLNQLRQKAQLYLQTLKDEQPFATMQAELSTRDEKIDSLTSQLQQAMDAIKTLQEMNIARAAEEDKPRGRRRKAEEEHEEA